jgi:hypothetical protein
MSAETPAVHIDASIDQQTAQNLLHAARLAVGPYRPTVCRVGYSDVRTGSTYSMTALVVAPPLFSVVEYRIGRGAEDIPVVQTFRLDQVVQVVSCGEHAYAVVAIDPIDSAWLGFQVEGPLVSLPHYTPAHELLAPPTPTQD